MCCLLHLRLPVGEASHVPESLRPSVVLPPTAGHVSGHTTGWGITLILPRRWSPSVRVWLGRVKVPEPGSSRCVAVLVRGFWGCSSLASPGPPKFADIDCRSCCTGDVGPEDHLSMCCVGAMGSEKVGLLPDVVSQGTKNSIPRCRPRVAESVVQRQVRISGVGRLQ
jgi:hypothetical protein